MLKKIIERILYKDNLLLVIYALLANILLLVGAWLMIHEYTDKPPCVVCGRSNTKPVKTLYEFQSRPIPQMKDVKLYYCPKHFSKAPKMVKKLPEKKDTIRQRFFSVCGFTLLTFIVMILTASLLQIHFGFIFLQPLILLISFLKWGYVASTTITLLFIELFALPAFGFYLWYYFLGKKESLGADL